MFRIRLVVLVFALGFFETATSAWADSFPLISVSGTVWEVPGNLQNAPTSAPSVGPAVLLGTLTANNVDFDTAAGTLTDFLDYGGLPVLSVSTAWTTSNSLNPSSPLGSVMSNCSGTTSTTSPSCYSTVIELTGTYTFVSGVTYTIDHDDGVVMFAGGNTTTPVINSAAPTSDIPSTWTPTSNVSGSFEIWYRSEEHTSEL